jgi:hypothetical protein
VLNELTLHIKQTKVIDVQPAAYGKENTFGTGLINSIFILGTFRSLTDCLLEGPLH